jgi:RNA-binding protein 39
VDDKDLFDFFSYVGRVLDIRLIRDQRTSKSKGLAYIEFWERDSVAKAISLNGCELGGYSISIQVVQSEDKKSNELPDIPMRLSVSNLHPDVGEEDLRPLFEAFGALENLTLAKEVDGKSKCFAYVTFKKEVEAKSALQNLDNLDLAGREIRVGVVDLPQNTFADMSGELDEGGGMMMSAQARMALMAKLQRGPGGASVPTPGGASGMTVTPVNVPLIQPTSCLLVKNMFDPATETEADFDLDIIEDVGDEAAKSGVKPVHIYVDKQHPAGHLFMRFSDIASCQKLAGSLHGRWFASRQISAEFIPEASYRSRFPW